MKKYIVQKAGLDPSLEMSLDERTANINGAEYTYEYKFISEDTLILRVNNKNHLYHLRSEENNIFNLITSNEEFNISCKNELDIIKDRFDTGDRKKKQAEKVLSPMPGAVISINVTEGQELQKGDVLMVLEAMKMENEILAHHPGVVKKISVTEKQSVDKGQLLMELSFS